MVNEGQESPEGESARNRVEKICLIANPQAAGGRVGKRLDELRGLIDQAFENWELRLTEGPGHATALASTAVGEGFDLVAAVGGDGTCHEVVNGLISSDAQDVTNPIFAVVPFGTGSDLVRSLETPTDTAQALAIASTGVTMSTDVGVAQYNTPDGSTAQRYFINVCGFGANGDVANRVNLGSKRVGGSVPYVKATLRTLADYSAQRVRLTWKGPEGDGAWEGNLLSAFAANGFYCGGGMLVGKGASMQDGMFALTVIEDDNILRLLLNLPRLFTGTIHKASSAFRVTASHVRAEALEDGPPILVELDGEVDAALPLELRILPEALRVRGGWR